MEKDRNIITNSAYVKNMKNDSNMIDDSSMKM